MTLPSAARLLRRRLLGWYRRNKRDLPWRASRDPYRIWISEIMLQQTRVAAAIPYFKRFLIRFPDVRQLAEACEADVLAAWAGLGYYTRARNLQKAAKKIVEAGGFPHDYDSILRLPGVGEYTAAAVASIAFELKHAAVDGNALRVLSRLTAERANIASPLVRKRLAGVADLLIDPRIPGEFNQAMMELGALICLPKSPQCAVCPLSELCEARALGTENELPLKTPRVRPMPVEKQILVIQRRSEILAWQRPPESARMAGFWELPEPEQLPSATVGIRIATFRHTIVNTNYLVTVHKGSTSHVPENFRWLRIKTSSQIPLSTTARKALACLGTIRS